AVPDYSRRAAGNGRREGLRRGRSGRPERLGQGQGAEPSRGAERAAGNGVAGQLRPVTVNIRGQACPPSEGKGMLVPCDQRSLIGGTRSAAERRSDQRRRNTAP